ncbi:hypothetical protein DPMN_133246 [Dreissena polymorpha]|uniref:EGF-like domain-containing protein n=1 Tax=Dreissena polymorpha TaxID=45954 RepID=A0A9D4FT68_DREPO|nr:hypothetical protein DPMN_133246 [Dreissena polymorpha]
MHFYYIGIRYVAGRNCKRVGPFSRQRSYDTRLTEKQLQDECGQFTAGFEIQCSFQWSETLFGSRSTPVFSEPEYVGLYPWVTTMTLDDGAVLIPWLTNTPFGCQYISHNYYYERVSMCELKWDVSTEGKCVTYQPERTHHLCGIRINAEQANNKGYHNTHWEHDSLGNVIEYRNSYGLKVSMSRDGVYEQGTLFKASFSELEFKHGIWDGYRMPDIKLYFVDPNIVPKNTFLTLEWDSGPVLRKRNEWNETVTLYIYEVGEFLLLKGTNHIVEIQMKSEECGKYNQICICAITFRNGNEVYTVNTCGATTLIGFLHIGEEEDGLLDVFYSHSYMTNIKPLESHYVVLTNGVLLKIDTNHPSRSLQMTLTTLAGMSSFETGITAFNFKEYRHKNGKFKTESTGFVESWRVANSDSLLNPTNHHNIEFDEMFYKCHCPSEKELMHNYEDSSLMNDQTVGSTQFIIQRNEFRGTLKCSQKSNCTVGHAGISVWDPIIRPDVVTVGEVNIETSMGLLECSFVPIPGKPHKVEWVSGKDAEESLLVHDMGAPYNAYQYDLHSRLFSTSGEHCRIENIRCAVTVYEQGGTIASGPAIYSKAFNIYTDLKQVPLSICFINGRCFFENDTNPNDDQYTCYPDFDSYHWIRNLNITRVPGDMCVRGTTECNNIPGGSYCSNETNTCQCYPTHMPSATGCDPKYCNYEWDCLQGTICLNGQCVCNVTAMLTPRGCVSKGLGSPCNSTAECESVHGAVCGDILPRTCVCGQEFNTISGKCYPRGLHNNCRDRRDCQQVAHASCYAVSNTAMTCQCDFGYSPDEFGVCHPNGDLYVFDPYLPQYPNALCIHDDECSHSLWWTHCGGIRGIMECVGRPCNNESNPDAMCNSSLLHCNLESGFCEPAQCNEADSRYCVLENTACNVERRYCDCGDGLTLLHGHCSPVIDRVCSTNETCKSLKGRYECIDNRCACNPNIWTERDGLCVTYKDSQCERDSDCGKSSNTTCQQGICSCRPGYFYRNGTCVSVYESSCTANTDCGSNFVCKYGMCRCQEGYGLSEDSSKCTQGRE